MSHHSVMDMGSSAGNSMMMGVLHTSVGMDTLWFMNWTPSTAGATAGTAIGLFMLAVFQRLLTAMRAGLEVSWRLQAAQEKFDKSIKYGVNGPRYLQTASYSPASMESKEDLSTSASTAVPTEKIPAISLTRVLDRKRLAPRFHLGRESVRGAFQAVQSALLYFLMLAVMTGNAYWFVAVCLGAGVGEFLFGRYLAVPEAHHA